MTTGPGIPGIPPIRLDSANFAWNKVASFDDYEQAQAAVDRLSDDGFPVEMLDIVGCDLRSVERVTGRLTNGRAAAAGAAQGAWFGLFIGLLVGLFTAGPTWLGLILGGLLIGAAWGAIAGYAGHAMLRGRRDFTSVRTLVAARYDLLARGGTVDQARQMLQTAGVIQPAAG
ncbi:MAG TPA: general stress protein [Jatrophihabitans sp.]|nr:general stress protein [Jatrophihabitans sp.]